MDRHAAPDQPGVAPLGVDGQIPAVAVPSGSRNATVSKRRSPNLRFRLFEDLGNFLRRLRPQQQLAGAYRRAGR